MREETGAPTIDDLLREARPLLALTRAEIDPREARTLLGHVLDLSETELITRGARRVSGADAETFRRLIRRRRDGEPVAYLTGERGFYGRDFSVDERVLIPRPETEHLIEAALALELPSAPRLLDFGTGSGAIAVTLACELAGATVVATDIELGPLRVARANSARHGVAGRVGLVRADLDGAFDLSGFDLVVSNPPYIGTGQDISFEVADFEPHRALFAPGQGRSLIRRLLGAAKALRPGVHLLLEIGFDQGAWLREKAGASRELELVELVRDYGGHERTAVLRRR
ncbi:MAG: peptide chain release factor N(5)-glutamine methyltransferase [Acidobacteriota bacterium]